MLEAAIEKYLIERVEALGGITAKMTVSGRRGWPDRLVIMPGGHVSLVEVKRPKGVKHPKGGVRSATQQQLSAKLAALGVNVVGLASLEEVDHFIYGVGIGHRGALWRASQRADANCD
jgi:hypothetical protein